MVNLASGFRHLTAIIYLPLFSFKWIGIALYRYMHCILYFLIDNKTLSFSIMRRRSKSDDTKMVKNNLINSYIKLYQKNQVRFYGRNIHQKRIQLLQIIHSATSNYLSWMSLACEQIAIHYQNVQNDLYSSMKLQSNNRELVREQSSDSQSHHQEQESVNTTVTRYQTTSIEKAQKLIHFLLQRNYEVPLFFLWNWRVFIGRIYNPDELFSHGFNGYHDVVEKIIQSHTSHFNAFFKSNITNNQKYNAMQSPLILTLYESQPLNQIVKVNVFRKMLNQIIFLRLLQVSKIRSQGIVEGQNCIQQRSAKITKQNIQSMTLFSKRPIQLFLVFSKVKSVDHFLQMLDTFYTNLLNLIAKQFNVNFDLFLVEQQFDFSNFQHLAQKCVCFLGKLSPSSSKFSANMKKKKQLIEPQSLPSINVHPVQISKKPNKLDEQVEQGQFQKQQCMNQQKKNSQEMQHQQDKSQPIGINLQQQIMLEQQIDCSLVEDSLVSGQQPVDFFNQVVRQQQQQIIIDDSSMCDQVSENQLSQHFQNDNWPSVGLFMENQDPIKGDESNGNKNKKLQLILKRSKQNRQYILRHKSCSSDENENLLQSLNFRKLKKIEQLQQRNNQILKIQDQQQFKIGHNNQAIKDQLNNTNKKDL